MANKPNHTNDPGALSCHTPAAYKLALGLDLGTRCGYCCSFFKPGAAQAAVIGGLHMGFWDLSAGAYDSGAIRFVRLRRFLEAVKPDIVAYEMVRTVPAGMAGMSPARLLARVATAAELLGAFRAVVVAWCEEQNIPCTGFATKEIKKFATGKGNAGKMDMVKACNERYGTDFDIETCEQTGADDVADAAFVCQLLLDEYAAGMPPTGVELP